MGNVARFCWNSIVLVRGQQNVELRGRLTQQRAVAQARPGFVADGRNVVPRQSQA